MGWRVTRRDWVTLLALGLLVALTAGLAVAFQFGLFAGPTAVRSLFAVVAAGVALAVYRLTRGGRAGTDPLVSPATHAKLVVTGGALAVAVTAQTGNRLLPLVVFLPTAWVLVGDQLLTDAPAPTTLLSVSTLFAVPAVTKYLTTGFYFGGTDTFAHVDGLRRLLDAQYSTALPHGYDLFPVFHFFTGAVSLLGDAAPYDAIVLTGLAVGTLFVPTAYLLAHRLFEDRRLALSVAAGVPLLDILGYHALYFFPQALAVALVGIGAYATATLPAVRDATRLRRLSAYLTGLVGVLVLTHHLTYILLAIPLGVALVVTLVRPSLAGRLGWDALAVETRPRLRYRWLFPLVVGGLAVVAYLVYSPSLIVFGIAGFAYELFGEVATVTGPRTFFYGASLPADSLALAGRWLASPAGVYASGLGALLLVGLYEFLAETHRYARRLGLLVAGLLFLPLFFPLPIAVPQVERFLFVFAVFALLPLGVGIARTLRAATWTRRYTAVALLLLAAVGTSGALTTLVADDVAGINVGERGPQTALTDDEYAALEDTATFLAARGTEPAAADYVTRRAAQSVTSVGVTDERLGVAADGLTAPPGYLVVRDSWGAHSVPVTTGGGVLAADLRWFLTTDERVVRARATRNVVHDAGGVAVLHSGDAFDGVLVNATGSGQ
jgi:hypothetical protein